MSDAVLSFPLYHGTSSLFIKSIQETGLGASNPVEQLGAREFFRTLYPIAQIYFPSDYEVAVTGDLLFQPSSVYLSPVELVAVRYALNNKYGSEFISKTLELYQKLNELKLSISELQDAPLLSLYLENPRPILITIKNSPVDLLRDDRGGEPFNIIMRTKLLLEHENLDETIKSMILEQLVFQFIAPLSPEHLLMQEIRCLRYDPVMPEYELIPIS
ncbi:hypothetical protein [Anthocerotibacter panamensis]|uniref:hypothetical protein n=1 Tax=Anthocerotibacter panamensis TaxID=2857077 RepID=UPI001C403774|nr:hypothetical protein [Anthocerotibacter panamensis]